MLGGYCSSSLLDRFDELAMEDPVKALGYLQVFSFGVMSQPGSPQPIMLPSPSSQTSVAAIVNHDDQEESAEVRGDSATAMGSRFHVSVSLSSSGS